jgi:hypothetical protein
MVSVYSIGDVPDSDTCELLVLDAPEGNPLSETETGPEKPFCGWK